MVVYLIVPARGGSKRVPRKNIRPLAGRPLLAWTIAQVAQAGMLDRLWISTEDAAIAGVARAAGAQVVERPPELAADNSSTEAVLLHALEVIGAGASDWVMTLPPTSPFRKPETIRHFVGLAAAHSGDVDCFMSVTENRGDFWRRTADGEFSRLFPDAPRRQQEREPLFEENSMIYVTRVAALRRTGFILGSKVEGVPVSAAEALDINTAEDFRLAELQLQAASAGA